MWEKIFYSGSSIEWRHFNWNERSDCLGTRNVSENCFLCGRTEQSHSHMFPLLVLLTLWHDLRPTIAKTNQSIGIVFISTYTLKKILIRKKAHDKEINTNYWINSICAYESLSFNFNVNKDREYQHLSNERVFHSAFSALRRTEYGESYNQRSRLRHCV